MKAHEQAHEEKIRKDRELLQGFRQQFAQSGYESEVGAK